MSAILASDRKPPSAQSKYFKFEQKSRDRHFGCSICPKFFGTKYNMEQHVITHFPNDRHEFKCTECPFPLAFTSKGQLKRHLKEQHSVNPRPFKCPRCVHQASRMENLKKHLNKVHPEYNADLVNEERGVPDDSSSSYAAVFNGPEPNQVDLLEV